MEMKVKRHDERLDLLNTISAAAVSSLNPDTVMHQILDLTCQTLDAGGGSILLSKPHTGGLFFAVATRSDADALRGTSLAPGQGIAGWVAQHGQSVCVNDVHHDPRWYNGIDKATGFHTHSLIGTPLVYHERVTGVIEIVNKREGEFTDDDLSLLEAVASITASALENARLYMTTRARVDELALLHEMGLALSSTLDPATVIHAALNQIMRLFRAERVSLFEPDYQTGALRSVKALFRPASAKNLMPGALENYIVEWSIEHGPILIEDIQNDPRFSDCLDQYLGYQARALMAAPLRTLGDAVGVIIVINSEPNIYTREELYILQTIVSTLTVALQNARLYDELKALLEEREQTQAHLIQTEKLAALGRLAASLAHEINNPLQALRSGLRLLSTRQPTEEKRRIYLDLISQEIERLVGIVERVLGFYRPSGRESVATDINAALGETLLLVGKQLEHSQVTVHRQFCTELPPVEAVADQLKQVFLNIILNALHAMPKGGELTVVTAWDAGTGEVYVAFTDTGVGIANDRIPRLFEPSFTVQSDGAGLGLTISYSIMERHGGRIDVESEIGKGSTFTVVLPAGEGISDARWVEGKYHQDQGRQE
jgi:signal transduction histidine kinase